MFTCVEASVEVESVDDVVDFALLHSSRHLVGQPQLRGELKRQSAFKSKCEEWSAAQTEGGVHWGKLKPHSPGQFASL